MPGPIGFGPPPGPGLAKSSDRPGVHLTPSDAYAALVKADGAAAHWRFGDPAGSPRAFDILGGWHAVPNSTITFGATSLLGQVPGDTAVTVGFAGLLQSSLKLPWPRFSMEVWIDRSGSADANFMQSSGGLDGAALNVVGAQTIAMIVNTTNLTFDTGGSLNTGPHHIVGTYDGTDARLYYDGALVAGPVARTHTLSTGAFFNLGGTGVDVMDEAAVYPHALSTAQVLAHYQAGAGAGTNAPAESVALTVVANNAAGSVAPTAGTASLTVAANQPSGSVAPNSGGATLSVAAGNVASSVSGTGGGASTTVAANNPAAALAAQSQGAALTVAANSPTPGVAPSGGLAALSVAAGNAAGSVVTNGPGAATGVVAAGSPTAALAVNAGLAGITVGAFDATVTTGSAVNAQAGAATLAVVANDAAASIATSAQAASVTLAALDATATTTADKFANAGVASITFGAFDAEVPGGQVGGQVPRGGAFTFTSERVAPKVYAHAGVATLRVVAYDATTDWNDDETALLLLAS